MSQSESRRDKAITELGKALLDTADRCSTNVVQKYIDGAEQDVSLDGYTTEQLEGLAIFFGELSHIEDFI